jgi:hypothetical protein
VKTIEIVTFRLRNGVDEGEFRAASATMEAGFASKQPGFLSRSMGKGHEGNWVDVVYWRDGKSATDAAEAFMSSEACAPFFQMIDEGSVEISHYEVV